jgi:GNAT superfamily N-acetyltransferase
MTGAADLVIRPLDTGDRDWVESVLAEHWGSVRIVTRGRLHDASRLPGLAALRGETRVGLLTYRVEGAACEVVSLNALDPGRGVGTALLERTADLARRAGCRRLWLMTTNDNVPAREFYSKRGFRVAAVHAGAIAASRKLKPEIPERGVGGVPITDEIEMERLLDG